MVELKDFVSETLKQVIEGIAMAQPAAQEKHARINPKGLVRTGASDYIVQEGRDHPPIPQIIESDVAVTASQSGEAKAGIGVFFRNSWRRCTG